MTAKKFFKIILFALKYLFGIGIVIYVFSSSKNLPLPDMTHIFKWPWLPLLISIKLTYVFAALIRWHFILKQLAIESGLKINLKLSLIGYSMNYILPGSISGDAVKGVFLNKSAKSPKRVFLSLFFDRFLGLFSVFFLIAIQFVWMIMAKGDVYLRFTSAIQLEKIYGIGLVTIAALLLFSSGVWHFRYHPKMNEVKVLAREFTSGRFIWFALGLSLLSHLMGVVFIYTAACALNINVSLLACFFIFSFTSFVIILPVTPGGLGVGQASYNYLLNLYNNEQTLNGATLFTILQFFDFFFVAVGGAILIYVLLKKKRDSA